MNMQQVRNLTKSALRAHEEGDYAKAEEKFLEALYLIDEKKDTCILNTCLRTRFELCYARKL